MALHNLSPISKCRIRAITAHLDKMQNTPVRWVKGKHKEAPRYPVYGKSVNALLKSLYRNGFVQAGAFDWHQWWDAEGRQYLDNPKLLAGADLATCGRLLTVHARADRLCDGWFGDMVENGHIAAVLRRLRELAE